VHGESFEFLDDSEGASLLVRISVVLTYEFTGVTPSGTSVMYRPFRSTCLYTRELYVSNSAWDILPMKSVGEGHGTSPRKQASMNARGDDEVRVRGTTTQGGRSVALWKMSLVQETVFMAPSEAGSGPLLGDLRICTVVWRPVRDNQERYRVQDGIWRPGLAVSEETSSEHDTDYERDGLGTNMRLEKVVVPHRRPKFLSFWNVCVWCGAYGCAGYPERTDVSGVAQTWRVCCDRGLVFGRV